MDLGQIARENDMILEDHIAYGNEHDRVYLVNDEVIIIPLLGINLEEKRLCLNFLKDQKGLLSIHHYHFENDIIIFKLKEMNQQFVPIKIKQLVVTINQFLTKANIPLEKHCLICHKTMHPKEMTVYFNQEIAYFAHVKCYKEVNVIQSSRSKKFKPIIRSLLFGVLSIMPWVMGAYWLSSLASLFAYLIGFSVYTAYTWKKPLIYKYDKWIVIVISLLFIFCAEAGSLFVIVSKREAQLTLNQVRIWLKDETNFQILIEQLGLGIVVGLMGLAPFINEMLNQELKIKRKL
jgi:hypothetical protein